MGRGGFEPPKQFAADLQSVPFGHSGIHPYFVKWDLQGSNLWPSACKADALPAELRFHIHMQFTKLVSSLLTTQKRLELSTFAVTGRRSNQLSHWAILQFFKILIYLENYIQLKPTSSSIYLSLLWLCPRPISNSQLHVLPHFHLCPIYLVVFKGSY